MNEEKTKNTSTKTAIEKTTSDRFKKIEKMILELESYYERLISAQNESFTSSNGNGNHNPENKQIQKIISESDTVSLIVIIITNHIVLANLLEKYLFRLKINKTIFLNNVFEAIKVIQKIEKSKENVVILLDFEFLKK